MKLPNGQRALIDDAKLLHYCLSTAHPRGRHKARLFEAALGLNSAHALLIKGELLRAVRDGEVIATHRNEYGEFYEVISDCHGPKGTASVLSVWIVKDSTQIPRLVTCYPI